MNSLTVWCELGHLNSRSPIYRIAYPQLNNPLLHEESDLDASAP